MGLEITPRIRSAMAGQWWWFTWEYVHPQEAAIEWRVNSPAHRMLWAERTVAAAWRRSRAGMSARQLDDELSRGIYRLMYDEQLVLWDKYLGFLVNDQWQNGLSIAERAAWVQAEAVPRSAHTVMQTASGGLQIIEVYKAWPKLKPAQFVPNHMGQFDWQGDVYEI